MDDSNLDLTEIALLLWGKFSNEIPTKVDRLPRGYKNTSFVIKTSSRDRLVLKIYAQNFLSREKIEERAEVVKVLEEQGLPVLEMLKGLDGKYCQEIALEETSYFSTLSKYVEIPLSETNVNEKIVQSVAEQLKLMHKGMSKIKNTKSIKKA